MPRRQKKKKKKKKKGIKFARGAEEDLGSSDSLLAVIVEEGERETAKAS